jgi:hypothetical protein
MKTPHVVLQKYTHPHRLVGRTYLWRRPRLNRTIYTPHTLKLRYLTPTLRHEQTLVNYQSVATVSSQAPRLRPELVNTSSLYRTYGFVREYAFLPLVYHLLVQESWLYYYYRDSLSLVNLYTALASLSNPLIFSYSPTPRFKFQVPFIGGLRNAVTRPLQLRQYL